MERRSGFLPPALTDSKNLGTGISIPYFFDLNKDKNFSLTSKIYANGDPLFLGEFHQAFKYSNFLVDFGYTEVIKILLLRKKLEISHIFSQNLLKILKGKSESDNRLSMSIQDVSNDKYLKLYKIKSSLVDYNKDTLESYISFTHEKTIFFLDLMQMYMKR